MAAAALEIGFITGCTLVLNYDDVTMQAGSLTLDNSQGLSSVSCSFTAQGVVTQSTTISPGGTSQMSFSPPATVVQRTINGHPRLFVQGLVMVFQALPSN
jgi:hypothetical protein